MDINTNLLRAIADETRMKILKLLLKHNYCVSKLAKHLELTESAISQHLKILKEVGLVCGEKRGYYMHYDVDREQLRKLASEIEELASIQREKCKSDNEDCVQNSGCKESNNNCSEEVQETCHGSDNGNHKQCKCHG